MVVHLITRQWLRLFFFLHTKILQKSLNELIFGYQIRTVNMDRYHGSQMSRALSVLDVVHENKFISLWRVQIDRLFS